MTGWPGFARGATRAARWLARIHSHGVDDRTDREFAAWIAADTDNARSYEGCELAWELAGELQDHPDIEAMLKDAEGAGACQPTTRRRRHLLLYASAACLAVAMLGAWLMQPSLQSAEHRTGVSEQRVIMLDDGSIVELNTATSARIAYSRDTRTIHLDGGEAVFVVAKDPRRPFEVRALGGITRAVGTQFNVDVSGPTATVSVLEGTVEVLPSPDRARLQSARLGAGQAATYVSGGAISAVHAADLRRIRAWRNHRIEFDDEALGAALEDYNRYTKTPIVLGSPELADRRVSGVFEIGDTSALLFALEQLLPITVVRQPDQVILLERPE